MYSHCEWCGRDIQNVPDIQNTEKISAKGRKKISKFAKSKKSTQSSGAFSTAIRMLSIVAVAVLIGCILYLAVELSFSIIYFIGVCLCIIFAYLLNVFPKIFLKSRAESIKMRTLLSAISLLAVAGAFVLAYFGIINS